LLDHTAILPLISCEVIIFSQRKSTRFLEFRNLSRVGNSKYLRNRTHTECQDQAEWIYGCRTCPGYVERVAMNCKEIRVFYDFRAFSPVDSKSNDRGVTNRNPDTCNCQICFPSRIKFQFSLNFNSLYWQARSWPCSFRLDARPTNEKEIYIISAFRWESQTESDTGRRDGNRKYVAARSSITRLLSYRSCWDHENVFKKVDYSLKLCSEIISSLQIKYMHFRRNRIAGSWSKCF